MPNPPTPKKGEINDAEDIKYLENSRRFMNDLGGKKESAAFPHCPLSFKQNLLFCSIDKMNKSILINLKDHTHKTDMLKVWNQEPQCLDSNLSSVKLLKPLCACFLICKFEMTVISFLEFNLYD
jgi:hypothetical protein